MRVLFFLIFVVLISCSGSTYNCGEIDRKFEKDGQYNLALILDESLQQMQKEMMKSLS